MRSRTLLLANWMLARIVPEAEREPLLGDLMEEYELRASASSSSAARKWYLRQFCASAPVLLWGRLSGSAWISTTGVALLAYIAVGVVELIVNWHAGHLPGSGAHRLFCGSLAPQCGHRAGDLDAPQRNGDDVVDN